MKERRPVRAMLEQDVAEMTDPSLSSAPPNFDWFSSADCGRGLVGPEAPVPPHPPAIHRVTVPAPATVAVTSTDREGKEEPNVRQVELRYVICPARRAGVRASLRLTSAQGDRASGVPRVYWR